VTHTAATLSPAVSAAAEQPVDVDGVARRAARQERLRATIAKARVSARGIDGERLLFILGSIAAPVGLLMIASAWKGTANTGFVFEQIPLLVSGGLGGVALVVLGGFLYFGWWQTRAIREARAHADRQAEALEALSAEVRALAASQRELVELLSRPPSTRRRA
jgi:hypothetical protein